MNLKFSPLTTEERVFLKDLKLRLNPYLRDKQETPLNWPMLFKAAVFFGSYTLLWGLVCFYVTNPFIAMGLCFLLGLAGTGLALNVGHEASHGTFSSRYPWVNETLYWLSMNSLGTYSYLWKVGHLETHHKFVNVPGHEVGIEGNGVIRMASHTPIQWFHAYQHIYAPLLFCFYTLTWVLFKDWRMLIQGEQSGARFERNWKHFAELFLVKVSYFTLMLYLPWKFSAFSGSEILIGFLLMHAVTSLYLALMLFTSHLNLETKFHGPDSAGVLPESYIRHHLESTLDVNPTSKLASFFLGGFNTHVIHHLFPNVSSSHYPAMTRILRTVCREHGMPYLEANFFEALVSHYRYLQKMGKGAEQESRKRRVAWVS